ncbi:PPC domain-containing protein [Sporosarcina sp. FSL K6-5500]|uniref:PPC domain-containing protein n=1 Tax=Sporosarcina sp. FSL K6-5500 TaxID=2921558 RepID=UPI0030FC945A
MRKLLSVLLSLLLVVTLLTPLQVTAANEELPFDEYGVRVNSGEDYQQLLAVGEEVSFTSKVDVALDHEWKINFSDIATPNKITAITIECGGKLIPVTAPKYSNSKAVTIKPVANYLGGQNYTLRILLKNGRKYKMDFATAKRKETDRANDKYTDPGVDVLYIDETIEGKVSGTNDIDFYKIDIPEDGQLTVNIKRGTNPVSLSLYGHEGDQGDLLAYTTDTTTSLSRELKKGIYYFKVTGNGDYEITTSFTAKIVDPVKELEKAQQAVRALPVPADAMPKHAEDIKQALALVATAKALGANAIEIEKLEIKIAALQKVVLPLEMKVTALNTKTLEVRFNRAIDTSVALFTVTSSLNDIPVKSVTFNPNKTIAKIELASIDSTGSYTVTVDGLAVEEMKEAINVKPATIESIEILGDTAVRIVGDQVSIGYRAENQYGEEMLEAPIGVTAKWTDPLATSSLSGATSDGIVKIAIVAKEIEEGKLIDLTLTSNKDKTKTVTKKIKISTQASVKGITIKEIYNEAGKKLNETTKLVKVDENDKEEIDADKFYLLIEATDQHGAKIDNEDILNVPGAISLRQLDSSIVNFVPTTEFKLIDKKDGTKHTGLRLTGTPKFGETEVTLTVVGNGQKDSIKVKVEEGSRTDVITLDVPSSIPADEELFIPINTIDKQNQPITKKEIITNAVSGIKFTINPKKDYEIVEKEITTEAGKIEKKVGIEFKKSQVIADEFTIKAESSTGKIVMEKITVKGKAVPTTWREVSPNSIQKNLNLTIKKDKKPQLIDDSKVQFIDQHGKSIGPTDGYSLVVTDQNPLGGSVSVVDNKITPIAIGTEIVTIAIKYGDTVLKGSEQPITFTVTDGSGYKAYEVEKIEAIYDALEAKKLTKQPEDYARDVIVLGVLENGTKERLAYVDLATRAYTFEALGDYLKVTGDGKINVEKAFYYGSKPETERTIGIKLNSSGEVLQAKVTISNVAPEVVEIQSSQQTIIYNATTEGSFDFKKLPDAVTKNITAKDQYGVSSDKLSNHQFVFPDGTPVASNLKFTADIGNFIFKDNNTKDAKVTDFSSNSSFNAFVTVGNISSNSVKMTVEKAHMPSVEAEIANITSNVWGKLDNDDNLLNIVQGLVGTGYTVTIKSSDNNAIASSGKVTQQDIPAMVNVVFVVKNTANPLLSKEMASIKIEVLAAMKVILAADSVGTAGNKEIIGLPTGNKYIVIEGAKYYGILADGKLSASQISRASAEGLAADLAGGKIEGLLNGTTYKVEIVAAKVVNIDPGSESGALAGDRIITGLKTGVKYIVSEGTNFYGLLANGSLSPAKNDKDAAGALAVALSGATTITGLTNGVTYKVVIAPAVPLAGVKATAGNGQATINFPAPTGATSVKVQQSTDGATWDTSYAKTVPTLLTEKSTSATVTGLTNGDTYYFRVDVKGGAYEGTSDITTEIRPMAPITIKAINGLIAPKTGESPVKDTIITEEYTATIEWNPDHSIFDSEKIYIAIIIIKPKEGYTLEGVTQNFFTVVDAIATNTANIGVITAVFPKTKLLPGTPQ